MAIYDQWTGQGYWTDRFPLEHIEMFHDVAQCTTREIESIYDDSDPSILLHLNSIELNISSYMLH